MPKRILLADDSITIQKVVELTFSDGDYEVVAVNNGAKAIQKLSQMRPDLILSDIIMPEKNGYEVCEYVKSHPEFRTIPVILLTGTFEPFDPDRADKAGCDAVVTKPFESQSLIHKVEELIQQSRASAQAAPPAAHPEAQAPFSSEFAPPSAFSAAPPAPSPSWEATAPAWDASEPSPFGGAPAERFDDNSSAFGNNASSFAGETPAFGSDAPAFSDSAPAVGNDVAAFGGDDAPAFGSSAESFATSSNDTLFTPSAPSPFAGGFGTEAPSPFSSAGYSAPPADPFATAGQSHGNEIFGGAPSSEPPLTSTMPFDDATPPVPEPMSDPFGGETRAFPRMNYDDLQPQSSVPEPLYEAAPEPSPWDEQADGGATRAFPRMSFDQLQQMANPAPAAEVPAADAAAEASPWDEQADAGATRAFPRMSFDELQQMASSSPAASQQHTEPEAEPEPSLWHTPEPEPLSSTPEVSPWHSSEPAPLAAAPEPSPWHSPGADAADEYSGETRAFPAMSFDELQRMQTQSGATPLAPPHEEPAAVEASPWDDAPDADADLGATRAFPRMSFEDLQQMSASSAAAEESPLAQREASPWDEPATAPQWSAPVESAYAPAESSYTAAERDRPAEEGFEPSLVSPFAGAEQREPPPMAPVDATAEPFGGMALTSAAASVDTPLWPAATSMPDEAAVTIPPSHGDASQALGGAIAAAAGPLDLTQEQVDRIARRVVEMMSEQIVRNIAWEVIPDVAQMAVRERIRELESEA